MADLIYRRDAYDAVYKEGCGICTGRILDIPKVEAIPIEWLLKKKASCIHMSNRASQTAWLIDDLIKEYQKDRDKGIYISKD